MHTYSYTADFRRQADLRDVISTDSGPIALLWAIMYDPSGVIECDAYTNIFISPVGAVAIIAHGSAVGTWALVARLARNDIGVFPRSVTWFWFQNPQMLSILIILLIPKVVQVGIQIVIRP